MMNTKLSQHRLWLCLLATDILVTLTTYMCVKLPSLYCGLRLILAYHDQ